MKVVVERAFGRFSIGSVIPAMPAGQARGLIARGLVREIADDRAMPSPADRMMRSRKAK